MPDLTAHDTDFYGQFCREVETQRIAAGPAVLVAILKALPKNAVISWPLPAGSPARTAHVSVCALVDGIEHPAEGGTT